MSVSKRATINALLLVAMFFLAMSFQNCSPIKAPSVTNSNSNVPSPNPSNTPPPNGGGTAPATPTGLNAAAVSAIGINLTWSPTATNVNSVIVERAVSNAGPFTPGTGPGAFSTIATLTGGAVSYSDSALVASTLYYYRISASNAAGTSAPSVVVSATTLAPALTVPAAPSGVTATPTAATIITVGWLDNSNNESYFDVERSSNNGVSFTTVANVSANVTSYQDINLTPQTAYTYRVRAVNSAGDSAYTANASATTLAAGNTATFSYVSVNIIYPLCASCHNANNKIAGYDYSSYNAVLGSVTAGNATGSELYKAITSNMPPNAPFTSSQISAIVNWINGGALNN